MRRFRDIELNGQAIGDLLEKHKLFLDGVEGGERLVIPPGFDLSDVLFSHDLSFVDMTGVNLEASDLSNIDIHRVRFCGANLRYADFSESSIEWCNFNEADLRFADFSWAKTIDLTFHSALMIGSIFRGGYDISGSVKDAVGIFYAGMSSDSYRFFGVLMEDGEVMVKAGCRWKRLRAARSFWENTRGGTELGKERLGFVDSIANHNFGAIKGLASNAGLLEMYECQS